MEVGDGIWLSKRSCGSWRKMDDDNDGEFGIRDLKFRARLNRLAYVASKWMYMDKRLHMIEKD